MTETIKIYRSEDGTAYKEVLITQNAEHEEELMKSDFVKLSWNDAIKYIIPVDAYIIPFDDGVRYSLLEPYEPEQRSEAEYHYEPKFKHPKMALGKKIFKRPSKDSEENDITLLDWTYVGDVNTLLGYFVDAIYDAIGERFACKIIGEIDVNIASVSFTSQDILSALTNLANVCDCECHLDWYNRTLYFGRVIYLRGGNIQFVDNLPVIGENDVKVLKVGDNICVPNARDSKEGYWNAFEPQGSTRNITRRAASGEYVQSNVRLSLIGYSTKLNGSDYTFTDGIVYTDGKGNIIHKGLFDTLHLKPHVKPLIFDDVFPMLDLYVYNVRYRERYLLEDNNNPKSRVIDHYKENGEPVYKRYAIWYMNLAYPTYDSAGNVTAWHDYDLSEERDYDVKIKKVLENDLDYHFVSFDLDIKVNDGFFNNESKTVLGSKNIRYIVKLKLNNITIKGYIDSYYFAENKIAETDEGTCRFYTEYANSQEDDCDEPNLANLTAFQTMVAEGVTITFVEGVVRTKFPKKYSQIVDGKKLYGQFKVNTRAGAETSPLAGRGTGDNGNFGFQMIYKGIDGVAPADNAEIKDEDHSDSGVIDMNGNHAEVTEKDYEIVFQQSDNFILPTTKDSLIIPKGCKVGNTYVTDIHSLANKNDGLKGNIVNLYNVVMDAKYEKEAKNDLFNTTKKYVRLSTEDNNTYTFKSDPLSFSLPTHTPLYIGQCVAYIDGTHYTDAKPHVTRVMKLVTKLDLPFEQEISVGNEILKGAQQTIREQVQSMTSIGAAGGGSGSGSGMSEEEMKGLIDELGEEKFLSKEHIDATRFLISFFAGLIADKFISSSEFTEGVWSKDEHDNDVNDGKGFSIWNNGVSDWHIELDYATVRHLLRAKEIYTQNAHIGNVTNQTIFNVGLQTLGDILLGHYAEGVEGGVITAEGHAELDTLITRGLAKLQELFVVNDSTFGGNLSNINFISGFLGGKGWAIQKNTRINAAGVQEEYYTLEIDNVTVRETLRVYEFIVSQLRGEFDNYVFAAMMEVHHYDPTTGKVWLYTENGRIRAVPFREGDYIMVQQYQPGNDVVSGGDGYITKHYELIVTDCGTGGQTDENGERLDWVMFKNFTTTVENGTAFTLIQQKDTFVRVDNETTPERKGLMQIITIGSNTPYQDVIYGLKTNPNDALKSRIGNLKGIKTELFGWLEGFGAYINNLYGVGKIMNAQTGESVESRFEVTGSNMRSVYKETTYDIEGNLISNGDFQDGLDKWSVDEPYGSGNPSSDEQQVLGDGDGGLLINGEQLATQYTSKSELTEYSGIRVLRIVGSGIRQSWVDMEENGTHSEMRNASVGTPNYDAESESYYKDSDMTQAQIEAAIATAKAANEAIEAAAAETVEVPDKLYMGVRMLPISSGTLTVKMVAPNGDTQYLFVQNINSSVRWGLYQSMDSAVNPWTWDVTKRGYIKVEYTGECLIRFVALQNDPISDMEIEYSTKFEQNSRMISLSAMKEEADHRQAFAQISIKYNEISSVVTNNKSLTDTAIQNLTKDLDDEIAARIAADGAQDDTFATYQRQTDSLIQSIAGHWDASGNLIGYSTTEQTAAAISSGVATANTNAQSYVNALKALINTDVLKDAQGNYAYATWKTQTNTAITNIAGKWDDSGNFIGYSTTQQTATAISTAVNAEAQRIDGVLTSSYSTTQQTANAISSAVNQAKTDINNNLTTNYSTKTQTADAITNTVTKSYIQGKVDSVYASKSEIPDVSDFVTTSVLQQTAESITSRVTTLETSRKAINDPNGWRRWKLTNPSGGSLTIGAPVSHIDSEYYVSYANTIAVTSDTKFYLNNGYFLHVAFINSGGNYIGSSVQPGQKSGALSITIPSVATAAYLMVYKYPADTTKITLSEVTAMGLIYTENNIMTEANLSVYVEGAISWFTASANNFVFTFDKQFIINAKDANNVITKVFDLSTSGDLWIKGRLQAEEGSNFGGTDNEGIRINDGELERYDADDGKWHPLFARREVRVINFMGNTTTTLSKGDDFVMTNGNYNKTVKMPANARSGKIISIKNVGGTLTIKPNTGQDIRNDDQSRTEYSIGSYDRAELVYIPTTWWVNVMRNSII